MWKKLQFRSNRQQYKGVMLIRTVQDAANNLPNSKPHYTIIANYSQNIALPHFKQSQSGDTHYFTPLKVNIFGVVDCSIEGGRLGAQVYHEGQRKNRNNISFLIMKEMKERTC